MLDRPLKIVQVNAGDAGGGAERCVMTLHLGLRALGHDATLYVGEKRLDEPGVVGIPYVRGIPGLRRLARWVESRTGWLDIYNPSFRNLVKLIPGDIDVVHFHNLWGSAGFADWGALPAITRRWPGVLTEHQNWTLTGHCAYFHDCGRWKTGCGCCPRLDLPPAIPRDGSAFNWRRKRRLIQGSRMSFVGVSGFVCELARQSPIWQNKTISRIYNGIDMKVFCPVSAERKQELRRNFGIPGGKLSVLLSGQTLGGYREGIATEGFDSLNRLSHPRVLPFLVGRQAEAASAFLSMPSVAIAHRASPKSMAECYQAVDLTLVTSKVEAFGRIAAESQACGTPVVSFDSEGLKEVVLHEVGGLSVRQGDTDGLCRALRIMLDNPELRRRYSERGIEYVRENFEENHITKQYVELYKESLARA